MSNGYMVFLKYCLLPVTPSKITTKINNANRAITLIDEGQVNLLKKAELTDVEFECMIPQTNYPFALYKSGFLGASFFLAYFERLKTSKKPFQFIVVRMKPNERILFSTNLKVTLEDYTIVEDAGQGLDLTVKINLKQWRDYRTKLVNIQENDDSTITATVQATRAAETAPTPTAGQTYTVKSGDSLCAIAKKYYGSSSKYTDIYNANKSVIGGNPNLIKPGQVLTLPESS